MILVVLHACWELQLGSHQSHGLTSEVQSTLVFDGFDGSLQQLHAQVLPGVQYQQLMQM